MPTSLTAPPADDETECGNCGAYIYHRLMKCPNCGVYLVDPIDTEPEERPKFRPKNKFALAIESVIRKIRGEQHPAEELFTGAMREASLFDDFFERWAVTGPWWSGSSSMNVSKNQMPRD